MSKTGFSAQGNHEHDLIEIRVKGYLDTNRWVDWFGGMTITQTDSGETLITGIVVDQAALHGLLKKVRDLGMQLVSVNHIGPDHANACDAE